MSQGPGDIPFLDYVINVGVAIIGGAVRFMRDWRTSYAEWSASRIWIEAVLAALIAGFSGVLTFWVLRGLNTDPLYTAFAVGIMGHMGPEGIALLSDFLKNGFRSRTQTPPQ